MRRHSPHRQKQPECLRNARILRSAGRKISTWLITTWRTTPAGLRHSGSDPLDCRPVDRRDHATTGTRARRTRTFEHPPINAITATTVAELRDLVGLIERDRDLNVVVFDSANREKYERLSAKPDIVR